MYNDPASEAVRFSNPEYEGEGDTDIGTLVRQTIDTATEMVRLAIDEKGWTGIDIVSGTRLMEFVAYEAAQIKGCKVSGFTPTPEEREKLERIEKARREKAKQEASKKPGPSAPQQTGG